MPKIFDVMAPIGKYNDPNTGQEKTRWLKCGMIVKTQAGKMALKLDAMPVAPVTEEGGLWLQLFAPNQDSNNLKTANAPAEGFRQAAPPMQGAPVPQAPAPAQAPAAAPATAGFNAFADDDIPF